MSLYLAWLPVLTLQQAGIVNAVAGGRPPSRKLWHIAGSKRRCWLPEKTTKCLWQEASMLRQRQQNSTFNCTQWQICSLRKWTIQDSTRRFVPLKLTTDRHEASRGLFATAELLVDYESADSCRQRSILRFTVIHDNQFETLSISLHRPIKLQRLDFKLEGQLIVSLRLNILWLLLTNPLTGTLEPQSNGPLYSNTVICTQAVDGWAVTFGTAMRGLGGLEPRPVPSSLYQM